MSSDKKFSWLLLNGISLVLGLSISYIAVSVLPATFHRYDIRMFWQWAHCWSRNWHEVYLLCNNNNYPILGTVSTAGLMSLVMTGKFMHSAMAYRLILSVVDGLNVLLIFLLGRWLKIEHAAYWAGIIGLSLSSWVGGALWGQIDTVGQFFILLSLAWIVFASRAASISRFMFLIYQAGCVTWLVCCLSIKQLTLFSVIPLFLMFITSVFLYERQVKWLFFNGALILGLLLIGFFGGDLFFRPPASYTSNFQYVWSRGNGNMDAISVNGFNIWIFSVDDPRSSALVPLFSNEEAGTFLELLHTPYLLGRILFLGVSLLAGIQLLRLCIRCYVRGDRFLNREMVLWWIFFLALANLSFNVLLSGTHERYLYHFYPLAFLSYLGLRQYQQQVFPFWTIRVLLIGAFLFGLFVLCILSQHITEMGDTLHKITGAFHAGLLVYWLMMSRHQQNAKLLTEA